MRLSEKKTLTVQGLAQILMNVTYVCVCMCVWGKSGSHEVFQQSVMLFYLWPGPAAPPNFFTIVTFQEFLILSYSRLHIKYISKVHMGFIRVFWVPPIPPNPPNPIWIISGSGAILTRIKYEGLKILAKTMMLLESIRSVWTIMQSSFTGRYQVRI